MNHLCFLSNLTSSEWAAWVQAVGTILAIAFAFLIANKQARIAILASQRQHESALELQRRQHQSALEIQQRERRHAELGLARTLAKLAAHCTSYVDHSIEELKDREALYFVASGRKHFDTPMLRYLENSVSNIPLHALPDTLVQYPVYLASTMRQFREKVESVIDMKIQREMDGEAFETMYKTFAAIQKSLYATMTDIENEVGRLDQQQ